MSRTATMSSPSSSIPSVPSIPSIPPSLRKLIIGISIYITTGIAQPILIDTLRINSLLGRKYLLLPTLANTVGMALCGLLASKSQWNDFRLMFLSSSSSYNGTNGTTNGSNKGATTIGTNGTNSITNKHSSSLNLKQMIIITSIIDLLSGMCLTFGILLTGGAIFVILYNSCPAWTALLSKVLLGKKMSSFQFIGVILVCIGLVTNVLGSQFQFNNGDSSSDTANANDSEKDESNFGLHGITLGSIIVLIGSLLHSLMFVLSDWSLSSSTSFKNDNLSKKIIRSCNETTLSPTNTNTTATTTTSPIAANATISGEIWSCCLGTIEVSFMLIWVLIGICTHGFYDDDSNGDGKDIKFSSIFGGFLLLVIIDTAHAAAFFALLKNIGAVASALLKGVQAVVVISLSAIFFCPREQSQCLDWIKVCSGCLVLAGVFCYGTGSSNGDNKYDRKTLYHSACHPNNVQTTDKSDTDIEMKHLI